MENEVALPTISPIKMQEGWKLKKLSQKHKNIIALHVQCMKREAIAQVVGCTPEYVSMIVAQPLAREYLKEIERYMDARMQALYSKTVNVIEKGLDGAATDVQLKAARLQMEATGKLKQDKDGGQSAEDVVAALLKAAASGTVVIGQNVQINNGRTDEAV